MGELVKEEYARRERLTDAQALRYAQAVGRWEYTRNGNWAFGGYRGNVAIDGRIVNIKLEKFKVLNGRFPKEYCYQLEIRGNGGVVSAGGYESSISSQLRALYNSLDKLRYESIAETARR